MIVGNPTVARGRRADLIYSLKRPQFLIYAVRDNLVFRNMVNPNESRVYTDHRSKITSVSEQRTAGKIAFGDEKGMVTIITMKETGEFILDKQF